MIYTTNAIEAFVLAIRREAVTLRNAFQVSAQFTFASPPCRRIGAASRHLRLRLRPGTFTSLLTFAKSLLAPGRPAVAASRLRATDVLALCKALQAGPTEPPDIGQQMQLLKMHRMDTDSSLAWGLGEALMNGDASQEDLELLAGRVRH